MGIKDENVVLSKSFDFAVRIVNLCKYLRVVNGEYVLSKQLLRSGTSIGANLHEAQEAISPKEFEAKVYISLKEAKETEYWLLLLHKTGYLHKEGFDSIMEDCAEILRLLASITVTLRKKYKSKDNK